MPAPTEKAVIFPRDARVLTFTPRGFRRLEAATYVGVCIGKFDEMVRDGRMPKPRRIDRRMVWDIRELDMAFDDLPHDGNPDAEEPNPWDEP